jgi:hypothetical protein
MRQANPWRGTLKPVCGNQLIRGWKLDRLVGGDAANRENVATVEWLDANSFPMQFPTVTQWVLLISSVDYLPGLMARDSFLQLIPDFWRDV